MIYENNLVFNICRITRKKVAKTEELPLSEINKTILKIIYINLIINYG